MAGWTIHREWMVDVGVNVLFYSKQYHYTNSGYLHFMLNLIMLWLKCSSVQVCRSRNARKRHTELVTLKKNINIKVIGIHESQHINKALPRIHYVVKAITQTTFNITNIQIMTMLYDHFHDANLTQINNTAPVCYWISLTLQPSAKRCLKQSTTY
jgi:hypothetical protein